MPFPPIRLFLIDGSLRSNPLVGRIIRIRPDVPVRYLAENKLPADELKGQNIPGDKSVYYLTAARGAHLKICQGMTDHYLCCRLHVIDALENCPLSCTYCFLHTYLNSPLSIINVDYRSIKNEIRALLRSNRRRLFRITSGELSDSLALEPLTGFAAEFIPFFARQPNGLLELKTKTDHIQSVLSLPHKGRTVLSWSLNTPAMIAREEYGSVSLDRRLSSARQAVKAGYRVAFHFDPLIEHENAVRNYARVVKTIFKYVPENKVAWISVGALRFHHDMPSTVMRRFPRSKAFLGEFVRGFDGKMRYIKPIRYALYRALVTALRKEGRNVFVYFCMENAEAWKKIMGFAPHSAAHLDYLFAKSLFKRFPDLFTTAPQRTDYA